MRKFFLTVFLTVFTCVLVFSPNNRVFSATIPEATGFVNDFANVLTAEQKTSLETSLSEYEKKTKNEISVVFMKSLDGDVVENVAVKLFEQRKIGKKGKDNGVLFLASINDRKMRIEVGYGLEPKLTDGRAGEIIRNVITPEFKNGRYFEGVKNGILAIEAVLDGGEIPEATVSASASGSGETALFILIAIAIGFWIFGGLFFKLPYALGKTKGFWLGGVGGGVLGGVIGIFTGTIIGALVLAGICGIAGLLLDIISSFLYQRMDNPKAHTIFQKTLQYWNSSSTNWGKAVVHRVAVLVDLVGKFRRRRIERKLVD